jgi:hypothetical protein
MPETHPDQSARILDAVFKVATGLILLAVGWVANELNDLRADHAALDARVRVIESTSYSPSDALEAERRVDRRIDVLESELRVMREILERIEEGLKQ